MKRLTIIISLLIISGIIFTYSCKKENTINKVNTELTEDQKLEQQIISFKNKLESKDKSNEAIAADEAVWYLDAVFNYSYTFPYVEYSEFSDSSTIITMEISGGSVNFSDLVTAYNKIDNLVSNHFFSVANNNKHLSTISVIKTENSTDNLIELEIRSSIGVYSTDKSSSSEITDPFGSTDYWNFMKDEGKCNGFTGGIGSEAGGEIAYETNRYFTPSKPSYYTNPVFEEVWPWDYPNNNPLFPEYDYLLFVGDNQDCLSPDDMNFYYHGLIYIAIDRKPFGKNIKTCDLIEQISTGKSEAVHSAKIWYGIRHTRTSWPENPHN